jgi:hypothetical protein
MPRTVARRKAKTAQIKGEKKMSRLSEKTTAILLITMTLITVAMVTPIVLAATYPLELAESSPLNNAKDNAERWVNYGNIYVYWTLESDPEVGYQYWWCQDRNRNGITGEGLVDVDYGPYGGIVQRNEGTSETDFGFEPGLLTREGKVVHLEESWVTGVTVPGETNKFIIKYNGEDAYIGDYQTILFWDGVTQQGDPPGPYLIMNKFYYYEHVNEAGVVLDGFYVQYQYMSIPETED